MSKNTPFFNHFIETQVEVLSELEAEQTSGGFDFTAFPPKDEGWVTMKHPSDSDEGHPGIELVTMKHPSDHDEGGELF